MKPLDFISLGFLTIVGSVVVFFLAPSSTIRGVCVMKGSLGFCSSYAQDLNPNWVVMMILAGFLLILGVVIIGYALLQNDK
jgi:uncharacterized membrane protein (UPF0136 family)